MRDLSPFARRSARREQRRQFYDAYMHSDLWRERRRLWAAAETARIAPATLSCRGCEGPWRVHRDDLHHCDYDRLGAERDEDLWPMCRSCHTRLHRLLDTFAGYRRMPRRQANHLALASMRLRPGGAVAGLRDAL